MPDTPDKQEPQKNELTVRRFKVKKARALSLMRMRKTLSSITLALFTLIWTKSPAAQSFISDPFGVKIDDSYYFSQKSSDSVKLMVSDLSSEGTQPAPFTFKSIGSMVRLGDRLIFAAE